MSKRFNAFRVEELDGEKPEYRASIIERSVDDLPEGEVLIRVAYSSLNYKDALSASGNKGVTRQYPHTPGIDLAGEVVEAFEDCFSVGTPVLVTGFDLGMNTDGGFAEYARVPASWVVPLPEAMSLKESMILGTAGLTAALCVEKLLQNGLKPEQGEVLVTGATGGVGSIAVALLAKLGFEVVACTGKQDKVEFLCKIGASNVIGRDELDIDNKRPLLKERWAGAVDVVGGDTLMAILKSLRHSGSVAACGLVGSTSLDASVFPFILRGVNLLGVDSVMLSQEKKQSVWQKLSTQWKLDNLEEMSKAISMQELEESLALILAGKASGRTVLEL
ncbi:MAG: YhdH/YhfP family quinone oxidoreductase [Pseudohongiellaceae bacterium]|nr:YhdH/YhfP family quinone oxidoreductase [Pseudohongiellaceae bacterium]